MTNKWYINPLSDIDDSFWQTWDQLNSDFHGANPILNATFVKTLFKYFPAEIVTCQLRDQSNKVSAVALLQKEDSGNWKIYKPPQAPIDLLLHDKSSEIEFKSLIKQLSGCSRIDFRSLDPLDQEPIMAALPEQLIRPIADNIAIEVTGEFDDYWAKRKKKLRYNIRNARKMLDQHFESLEFSKTDLTEHMSAKVDVYGEIESLGWKGTEGSALHPGNVQGQFFREIMQLWADDNNARVYELTADGSVIASILCCYNSQMSTVLKMTYNEEYRNLSAGRVLLHYLIQDVFENQVSKNVEFYTNADDTFKGWSTSQRNLYSGKIYSNSLMHTLIPTLKYIRKKIKRFV